MSIFSRRGALVVLLAWIAILGFDLFLHGALLAGLYLRPSPFLLQPMEAFRRIPVGYLGFLVVAAFLVWMLSALGARGARKGLQLGAVLGGALWVSLGLGLYSITTASPVLLISWAVGQTVEMACAGAIVGWALEEGSLKKPYLAVLAATLALVILTIAAQSSGLAPHLVHPNPFGRLEGRGHYLETVEPPARNSVQGLTTMDVRSFDEQDNLGGSL